MFADCFVATAVALTVTVRVPGKAPVAELGKTADVVALILAPTTWSEAKIILTGLPVVDSRTQSTMMIKTTVA